MSWGVKDRYGNLIISNSTGYYPIEHAEKPAIIGIDPVNKKEFKTGIKPTINDPDRKYQAFLTKYGHLIQLSDIGFNWTNEFTGDSEIDKDYEIKRWKHYTKLLNENTPTNTDQRKICFLTRSGHKFEMRDVGWAQSGGGRSGCKDAGETKSRNEYDEGKVLSKEKEKDERWIKFRTKGGMLIQCMDMGFHPESDKFYQRKLIDEVGSGGDEEDIGDWIHRDARQIRFVTRYGVKLVLDDRGTDPLDADGQEVPRGLGWLLKTRRSWEDGPATPRGFGFEAVDRDELNRLCAYSPKSKVFELNDKYDYAFLSTDVSGDISEEWQKLRENEFATNPALSFNPESDTYHLKLDKGNGYIRLKTSGGRDNGRRGAGGGQVGVNQGVECRDGRFGVDGAWSELVDIDDRGLWFSNKYGVSVLRSKSGRDVYVVIRDSDNSLIIRNGESGPIQIYCKGNVEVISERNIALKAKERISLKAGKSIDFEAGGSGHASLSGNAWVMDVPDNAPKHTGFLPGAASGGGAQSNTGSSVEPIEPVVLVQDKLRPDDRGAVGVVAVGVGSEVIRGCVD